MKKYVLLFIILFLAGCEKEEGESYPKDLIGNWKGFERNYSYNMISNLSQTVTNPYAEGTGSIELNGAETASLKYIYFLNTNGIVQIAMAKNVFGVISEDINFSLNIYDYGDLGSYSQLKVSSDDAAENYEGELEFSLISDNLDGFVEIAIVSGALYNEFVNDSVTVTGTLTSVQENVDANNEIEIGNIDWEFVSYEISFLINEDKSFEQTIRTIDSETLEYSGTWDATHDAITFHHKNYSETFEYSVSNSGLELMVANDLCLLNPDVCLSQYELMYGMEVGSLESVILNETTFFNRSSN
ncbi:MAG: hypothetical protein ACE5D0_01810 [Fidelibacterota bacterium]